MQYIGSALLISGWLIVLATLALLHGFGERLGFVSAGLAVEILGVGLMLQGYRTLRSRAGG